MFSLPENFSMMISAPRRAGKSFLLCMMLRERLTEDFDHIFVFCPTISLNDNFKEFREHLTDLEIETLQDRDAVDINGNPTGEKLKLLPIEERRKFHLHDTVDEEAIMKVMNEQKEAVMNVRERERIGLTSTRCPKSLMIFDDCVGTGVVGIFSGMNKAAYTGRHFCLSFIILTQHFNKVGKGIRMNSDMMVILRPFAVSELETFLEQFTIRKSRKTAMETFMNVFTKPRHFIVLKNYANDPFRKLGFSHAQEFCFTSELEMFDIRDPKNITTHLE